MVWTAIKTFVEIDGEQRAASFAYYALFSLFPLVALLLSAGSLFFDPAVVIRGIERFIPLAGGERETIWQMVGALERSRGGISLVFGAILLWSSLRFFQALVRGVNRAWHTKEIPWWQMPLKNLSMVAVFASALLIGLIAPALVQGAKKILLAFEDFIEAQLPGANLDLVVAIFDFSRYVVAGFVLFYAFTLLFMLAPSRRVKFREIWLPALFVTVTLQVLQTAFVNYLPKFINYNAIYGSVGVMMLLLLWVYVSGVVIILGACLCSAPEKLREEESETGGS